VSFCGIVVKFSVLFVSGSVACILIVSILSVLKLYFSLYVV